MTEHDDLKTDESRAIERVRHPRYPLAATWDPTWQLENMMGTNPLWLTEELLQHLPLLPEQRVLDLGCGKGMSSIFLAKERKVNVWAADLWVSPDDTWHLFGLGEGFVSRIANYVAEGGYIAMIVPGLREEFKNGLPAYVIPFWQQEFWSLHSAGWWKALWQQEPGIDVLRVDPVAEGWKPWLLCEEIARDAGYPYAADDIELLRADAGQNLGFVSVVAPVNPGL